MASLGDLGRTALGAARIRAAESARPDRLFDDPLAAAFVAADPASVSEDASGEIGAALATGVVIRTRLLDERLAAATTAGCRQVVLLGAGLDARAFRLDWPTGTRVFEVDLPEVLAFKERELARWRPAQRCVRLTVPSDLSGDWIGPLVAAGFVAEPTAWLAEGLLVYLTRSAAARLLDAVTELSVPGSLLAFEYGGSVLDRLATLPSAARYSARWPGGLGRDTRDFLDARGWRTELRTADHLGRGPGGVLSALR